MPWQPADPSHVWIHTRFDEVKGTYKKPADDARPLIKKYESAKKNFDMAAATEIVEKVVSQKVIENLVDAIIEADLPARIVVPHPEFDAAAPWQPNSGCPTNALPFAFAAYLSETLGAETDADIIEIARPGRTKLNNFERFLWQPKFDGLVRADHAYIIADDVCTMAGTLAMLRSHIVAYGGTVIAATALAHNEGAHQRFPIDAQTVNVLKSLYSSKVDDLWVEEIGHGIEFLTENEGVRLEQWARSQRVDPGHEDSLFRLLRGRLYQAAAKGGA